MTEHVEGFDLVVIGAGAGGLTAAMYGARLGLKTVVLEGMMPGGQIINAEKIENFPGFPDGLLGADLAPLIERQASAAGAEGVNVHHRYLNGEPLDLALLVCERCAKRLQFSLQLVHLFVRFAPYSSVLVYSCKFRLERTYPVFSSFLGRGDRVKLLPHVG